MKVILFLILFLFPLFSNAQVFSPHDRYSNFIAPHLQSVTQKDCSSTNGSDQAKRYTASSTGIFLLSHSSSQCNNSGGFANSNIILQFRNNFTIGQLGTSTVSGFLYRESGTCSVRLGSYFPNWSSNTAAGFNYYTSFATTSAQSEINLTALSTASNNFGLAVALGGFGSSGHKCFFHITSITSDLFPGENFALTVPVTSYLLPSNQTIQSSSGDSLDLQPFFFFLALFLFLISLYVTHSFLRSNRKI